MMKNFTEIKNSKKYILVFFILTPIITYSQLLKKLTKVAGDAMETGWRATTAPYKSVLNSGKVLTGQGNVKQIYEPYKKLGNSAGNTISNGTDIVSSSQNYLFQKARNFSSQLAGEPGEFIFDMGTFTNQYYNELAATGAHGLANILRGQNPFELFAGPLAAAIRAGREQHFSNSKSIPNDVKEALKGYFPSNVLSKARYAVGKVEITLPNFIGRGSSFMGNDYAVVVDDIIVFNSTPPSFESNPFWWIHEIEHINQYTKWGIDTFAYKYLKDIGASIENAADEKAENYTNNNQYSGKSYLTKEIGLESASSLSTQLPSHNPSGKVEVKTQSTEYFVAKCFFMNDLRPIQYLITNTEKIIAVDMTNGEWAHLGYCTPPLANGVAWTYQTPNLRYAVNYQGKIFEEVPLYNNFGQIVSFKPVQIGYVIRL